MSEKPIRIGSRGSRLALIQAEKAKALLQLARPKLQFEIIVIKTEGDIDRVSPIHEIGGKGAFVKNIELALCQREIDVAIHSLKDITSRPLQGLELAGFLPAEAITDALVAKKPGQTLANLPAGSLIATGSLRRKAFLQKNYAHLKTIDIRGNVHTRLEKLQKDSFDGLLLSEAGLIRLGLADQISERYTPQQFCPAPGQGVITIQVRHEDLEIKSMATEVSCPKQALKSQIELAFLEKLEFNCHAPLGAYAEVQEDVVQLHVFAANTAMQCFLETKWQWQLSCAMQGARAAALEVIKWLQDNE